MFSIETKSEAILMQSAKLQTWCAHLHHRISHTSSRNEEKDEPSGDEDDLTRLLPDPPTDDSLLRPQLLAQLDV